MRAVVARSDSRVLGGTGRTLAGTAVSTGVGAAGWAATGWEATGGEVAGSRAAAGAGGGACLTGGPNCGFGTSDQLSSAARIATASSANNHLLAPSRFGGGATSFGGGELSPAAALLGRGSGAKIAFMSAATDRRMRGSATGASSSESDTAAIVEFGPTRLQPALASTVPPETAEIARSDRQLSLMNKILARCS